MPEVQPRQAQELGDAQLVDVRTDHEWDAGVPPGFEASKLAGGVSGWG